MLDINAPSDKSERDHDSPAGEAAATGVAPRGGRLFPPRDAYYRESSGRRASPAGALRSLVAGARAWRRRLAAGSVNQRIFGAALVVTILTVVVNLLSFAKEVVVAASFGAGDAMDAFLIALVIPQTVIGIVASTFNAALVPTYIRVREREGQEAAQRLFSSTVVLSAGILSAVAAALGLLAPMYLPLLAAGFGPEKLALTQGLLFTLLPAVVLCGLATTWGGLLTAGERFGLVAIAPALIPIATIALLLGLGEAIGVYALALGMVVGFALHLAVLGRALRRQGISLWPRWHGRDESVNAVLGQYLPLVAGQFTLGSTVLIDQVMASTLDPGSVAALGYGGKIVIVLTGLVTVGLATAVLPYFSKMIAQADMGGLGRTMRVYTGLVLLATVPMTAAICLFSEPLIRLLLQRGAFTAGDTALVAQVQTMLALGIAPYAVAQLYVRLISSLRANAILMWGNVINWVVNIGLNIALMRVMGVAGIALATSIVYLVNLIFLTVMVRRRLKGR